MNTTVPASTPPQGFSPEMADLLDRFTRLVRAVPGGLFAESRPGRRGLRLRLHRVRRLSGGPVGDRIGEGRAFEPPLVLRSFPPSVLGRAAAGPCDDGGTAPGPGRIRAQLRTMFGDVTGLAVWATLGGLAGMILGGGAGAILGALAGIAVVAGVSWHVARLARDSLGSSHSALPLPPVRIGAGQSEARFHVDLRDAAGHFRLDCSWEVLG